MRWTLEVYTARTYGGARSIQQDTRDPRISTTVHRTTATESRTPFPQSPG